MRNRIEDTFAEFIGNRTNAIMVDVVLYGMVFYIISLTNITMVQSIGILILLVIINLLNEIKNVAKGMMIATLHREKIKDALKQIEKDILEDEE